MMISAAAFSKDGNFITGLKSSDFQVFVDDKAVDLTEVKMDERPINLVLLFDMSPSTDAQIKLVKTLAAQVIGQLHSDDRVMVAKFSAKFKIAVPFTTDRKAIAEGVENLVMDDGTSIYEAIGTLIGEDIEASSGRTAVVIMTDGVDTTSRKWNYETSLFTAEKSNITIFPVYFDTFPSFNTLPSLPFPIVGKQPNVKDMKKEYDRGRFYLADLQKLSGGRAMLASKLTPEQMAAFSSIPSEMRVRYDLRFRLPEGDKAGERHHIRVRVNRPDLTILAKASYIAN